MRECPELGLKFGKLLGSQVQVRPIAGTSLRWRSLSQIWQTSRYIRWNIRIGLTSDRALLWNLLRSLGVQVWYFDTLRAMYSDVRLRVCLGLIHKHYQSWVLAAKFGVLSRVLS